MEAPKSWSEDQPCVVTVVIDLAPSVGRRIRIIRQLELADIEKCCEAQSARQCLWQQMGRIWARLWQSCFQMSLSRYFWYWWRSANAMGQDNLPSQGQHFSSCSYRLLFCQLKSVKQLFLLSAPKPCQSNRVAPNNALNMQIPKKIFMVCNSFDGLGGSMEPLHIWFNL